MLKKASPSAAKKMMRNNNRRAVWMRLVRKDAPPCCEFCGQVPCVWDTFGSVQHFIVVLWKKWSLI